MDPLTVIEDDHTLQLELCDLLEALADGLPRSVNQEWAAFAIEILSESWPAHVALEEDVLFPLLRARAATDATLTEILSRLEQEHVSDEDFAHEIAEELTVLISEGAARNPDMLGYMLRGFFDSQRRHVAWENMVLLPVARRLLGEADLTSMRDWIAARGGPRTTPETLQSVRSLLRGRQPGAHPGWAGDGDTSLQSKSSRDRGNPGTCGERSS